MANYMLADADKLDSDLTKVADSIRAKGGTTEPLAFPDGFAAAVNAIVVKTGTEIKRNTGTVKNGNTISCGWKPDLVYITKNQTYDGYLMCACFPFEVSGNTKLNSAAWPSSDADYPADCYVAQTSNGFSFKATIYDESQDKNISYTGSFQYVAVKYTE